MIMSECSGEEDQWSGIGYMGSPEVPSYHEGGAAHAHRILWVHYYKTSESEGKHKTTIYGIQVEPNWC